MGVSHLNQYSKQAASAQGNTGYAGAVNAPAGAVPKAGKSMPAHSASAGYSREALHAAGNAAKQAAKGGVRAGAKSGQERTGASQKGILGKTLVLPNGGRKG